MRKIKEMQEDCEKMARKLSIPYNHEIMTSFFQTFAKSYEHELVPVSIRSTTKSDHGMNIRYVDFWNKQNPYKTAVEKGYIKEDEHPIYKAFDEIKSQYPIMGYGVDCEANLGFQKIWLFFAPHLLPDVYKVCETKSLPSSMAGNMDFFEHFGIKIFSAFGLDYFHKSSNLYFMNENIGELSKDRLASMFQYLKFDVPSDEELELCQKASTFYCTYSWESKCIERICFGVLNENVSTVPTSLNSYLKKYTDNAMFMSEFQSYIYSLTYAREGDYLKIENDYSGTMIRFMNQNS